MEQTIIDNLGILIVVSAFCIMIINIIILKDVTDIKEMLKKHFKDKEKEN